ncbi:MAG: PIN domain-containing protein [Trueperaceae bacterium]
MTPRTFFDTNVLVYLFDESSPDKKRTAQELFHRHATADALLLSTQVLQEFYVTVTRKLADPLPPTDAVDVVRRLSAFSPTEIDAKMIVRAAERSETDMLSLWDALIVEAALAAGAERIFSEDMQDGRNHSGIVIHNPF